MVHMLDFVLKISCCNGSRQAKHEASTAQIIFYDQTQRGVSHLRKLIKSFDNRKWPQNRLSNLVEMTYIMLQLTEPLKQVDGTSRILNKSKKKNRIWLHG